MAVSRPALMRYIQCAYIDYSHVKRYEVLRTSYPSWRVEQGVGRDTRQELGALDQPEPVLRVTACRSSR